MDGLVIGEENPKSKENEIGSVEGSGFSLRRKEERNNGKGKEKKVRKIGWMWEGRKKR